MSAEIGGANAIEPLEVAAMLNLPVVDCDGMGRAFPELQVLAGHQAFNLQLPQNKIFCSMLSRIARFLLINFIVL